jgi:putative FmdB family regulatory protein
MPTYEYACETCGPFSEVRPMAEFAAPQPCPACGALASRMLTVPQLAGGATEAAPAGPMRAHAGGCACCAAPRRFAAEAV